MTLPQCLTTEISTISYEFQRPAMKVSKRGKTSTPDKEMENERTHSKRRDGSDERVTKEVLHNRNDWSVFITVDGDSKHEGYLKYNTDK